MRQTVIKTIPHKDQRYPTCADYFISNNILQVKISALDNSDYEFLISLHEQIEAYLVEKRGISIEAIDSFDMEFKGEGEPGDNPDAPYHAEHNIATEVEKFMAVVLGINWLSYDKAIKALFEGDKNDGRDTSIS